MAILQFVRSNGLFFTLILYLSARCWYVNPVPLFSSFPQIEGRDPTSLWTSSLSSVSSADLDALFARLDPWVDLTIPIRHNKVVEARRAAEEEVRFRACVCVLLLPFTVAVVIGFKAWLKKLETYIESGEAPGYIGTLFRERYTWL